MSSCPNCGMRVAPEAKYCPGCGGSLGPPARGLASQPVSARAPAVTERRITSAESSTLATVGAGPRSWAGALGFVDILMGAFAFIESPQGHGERWRDLSRGHHALHGTDGHYGRNRVEEEPRLGKGSVVQRYSHRGGRNCGKPLPAGQQDRPSERDPGGAKGREGPGLNRVSWGRRSGPRGTRSSPFLRSRRARGYQRPSSCP